MRAGDLRDRVTIQSPPATPDGFGGWTGEWSTVSAGVPARVEGLSGDEAIEAGALAGVTSYRVTMRRRQVLTRQRLLWRDPVGQPRLLEIRSAIIDRSRAWVVCLCQAVEGADG